MHTYIHTRIRINICINININIYLYIHMCKFLRMYLGDPGSDLGSSPAGQGLPSTPTVSAWAWRRPGKIAKSWNVYACAPSITCLEKQICIYVNLGAHLYIYILR